MDVDVTKSLTKRLFSVYIKENQNLIKEYYQISFIETVLAAIKNLFPISTPSSVYKTLNTILLCQTTEDVYPLIESIVPNIEKIKIHYKITKEEVKITYQLFELVLLIQLDIKNNWFIYLGKEEK